MNIENESISSQTVGKHRAKPHATCLSDESNHAIGRAESCDGFDASVLLSHPMDLGCFSSQVGSFHALYVGF